MSDKPKPKPRMIKLSEVTVKICGLELTGFASGAVLEVCPDDESWILGDDYAGAVRWPRPVRKPN